MKHNLHWQDVVSTVAAAVFLAVSFSTKAQQPLDPQLAALPVYERIAQAPVFLEPIVCVGEGRPERAESEALWAAIEVMREQGAKPGVEALEMFLETHPESRWTPSVRASLGYYYRDIGRYSLALKHLEAAWEATQNAPSANGKKVADYALAHWTRLLARLGRVETLAKVFRESDGRVLDGGPLEQVYQSALEGYLSMLFRPEASFRCGSLAVG